MRGSSSYPPSPVVRVDNQRTRRAFQRRQPSDSSTCLDQVILQLRGRSSDDCLSCLPSPGAPPASIQATGRTGLFITRTLISHPLCIAPVWSPAASVILHTQPPVLELDEYNADLHQRGADDIPLSVVTRAANQPFEQTSDTASSGTANYGPSIGFWDPGPSGILYTVRSLAPVYLSCSPRCYVWVIDASRPSWLPSCCASGRRPRSCHDHWRQTSTTHHR